MADRTNTDPARMEKIVSLCKRRGFIFQAAEIYGGLNGCWDYGPMGVELKRNLKEYWWRKNVQERDDVVGMDGSILTHNSVLVASGHVGGFSDPMCDCLLTKERLRADQVPAQSGMGFFYTGAAKKDGSWSMEKEYSVLVDSEKQADKARKTAAQYYAQLAGKDVSHKEMELKGERMEAITDSTMYNPANGSLLTEAREFNLMFKTTIGATSDENDPNATGWLRPETAQSIFCQYKNILDSSRVKLPFGIAQIGKSFRNEINPRNFTFRSREFEQMEIEYFCRPEDGLRLVDEWLEHRLCFYDEVGVPREHIHILDVPDGERAFYSKKTYDLEYEFPFGIQELEGIAYRTDYDLSCHQKGSGRPLEYLTKKRGKNSFPMWWNPPPGVTAPFWPSSVKLMMKKNWWMTKARKTSVPCCALCPGWLPSRPLFSRCSRKTRNRCASPGKLKKRSSRGCPFSTMKREPLAAATAARMKWVHPSASRWTLKPLGKTMPPSRTR